MAGTKKKKKKGRREYEVWKSIWGWYNWEVRENGVRVEHGDEVTKRMAKATAIHCRNFRERERA